MPDDTITVHRDMHLTLPGEEEGLGVSRKEWENLRKCVGRIQPQAESPWFAVSGIAFGVTGSFAATLVGLENTEGVNAAVLTITYVVTFVALAVALLCGLAYLQMRGRRARDIADVLELMDGVCAPRKDEAPLGG